MDVRSSRTTWPRADACRQGWHSHLKPIPCGLHPSIWRTEYKPPGGRPAAIVADVHSRPTVPVPYPGRSDPLLRPLPERAAFPHAPGLDEGLPGCARVWLSIHFHLQGRPLCHQRVALIFLSARVTQSTSVSLAVAFISVTSKTPFSSIRSPRTHCGFHLTDPARLAPGIAGFSRLHSLQTPARALWSPPAA
jgi:hypothetical protein